MVRRTLIQKSLFASKIKRKEPRQMSACREERESLRELKTYAPQPRSRKTPRGGRKMAKMILTMSLQVKGMMGGLRVGGRVRKGLP